MASATCVDRSTAELIAVPKSCTICLASSSISTRHLRLVSQIFSKQIISPQRHRGTEKTERFEISDSEFEIASLCVFVSLWLNPKTENSIATRTRAMLGFDYFGIIMVTKQSVERREHFETPSGIELPVDFNPSNTQAPDYEKDLGAPGEFPYTRGIRPNMYRGRLWTMRQYA